MSVGTCLSKSGLTLINLLFFAVGCGLVFLGSFMFREYARYGNAGAQSLGTALLPALIVIAAGILAILLGVVGCAATFNKKKCMTGVYFTLLLIMLAGLITGAVLSYVYKNKIDEKLHGGLIECLNKYLENGDIKAEVDVIQSEFECCGVDNATDWLNTEWYQNQTEGHAYPYPASCCKKNECTYKKPDENLHNKGCYSLVKEQFKSHLYIIGAVTGGFALILVIGMVLSCVLIMRKRQREQEVPYVGLPDPDGMRI